MSLIAPSLSGTACSSACSSSVASRSSSLVSAGCDGEAAAQSMEGAPSPPSSRASEDSCAKSNSVKGENSGKLTEPRDAFDAFGGRVCEESGQALAQISEPRGPKERFEGGMLRQRRSGNKGQGTVAAKNARHQHRNEGRWGRCLTY